MLSENGNLSECRICKSKDLLQYLSVNDEQLDKCSQCDYVQVRNKPDAEKINEIYSKKYFQHTKYRDPKALNIENMRRFRLLDSILENGATVLDAGCSTGDFIAVAKKKFQMYGTDISEYAINQAQIKNPALSGQLVAGRLEDSIFSDKKFDAICLWDVIEHVWDPILVIDNLISRLKPQGYLFISTPAIDAITARVLGRYWAFMTPPEHLGFFANETFEYLFEDRFGSKIIRSFCKGKWANLAFIAYKMKRITPIWFPNWILLPLQKKPLSSMNIYVPTKDVRYLAVQYNEKNEKKK